MRCSVHLLCCRSMLCDSFKTVMESLMRRFAADAQILGNEKKQHFIDMRKYDEVAGVKSNIRQHKKKLSTYMMYDKEAKKMHNQTCCPWSAVKTIPGTSIFVLLENVPAKEAKESRQGKPAKVLPVSSYKYTNDKLQAAKPAGLIAHVVDLTDFDWQDSESNK